MPALVRDHTLRFTFMEKVGVAEVNDLLHAKYSDLRCVQVKDAKNVDVTFCSVSTASKILESSAFELGSKVVLVSPVDKPRVVVQVNDLPFEIQQADVTEVLKTYGEVYHGEREKYRDRPYDTGNRSFLMYLTQNIPRYIDVLGYQATVYHKKQDISCSYCKTSGHVRQQCTDLVCRICGNYGHFSYSCPRRRCKSCHQYGHWARECPDLIEDEDVDDPAMDVSVPVQPFPSSSFHPSTSTSSVSKPDCPPTPSAKCIPSKPVSVDDPFSDDYEKSETPQDKPVKPGKQKNSKFTFKKPGT